MDVALLAPRTAERLGLERVVASLGHRVSAYSSARALVDGLAGGAHVEVALLDVATVEVSAAIEALRRTGADRHVYVIGLVRELSAAEVSRAYEVGADDVMRLGASGPEVVGRVGALARIRSWRDGSGSTAIDDSPRRTLWDTLGGVAARELAQLLGVPLRCEVLSAAPECSRAAEVPVSVVGAGEGIRLGVGLEASCVDGFVRAVFGDPVASELVDDALREHANCAAGGLKRSLQEGPVRLAIGVPVTRSDPGPARGAKVWVLTGESVRLILWASPQHEQPRRVATATLHEGWVLAEDIRNAGGVLLVAAGTVLTRRTVTRLVDLVGGSALVDVYPVA